jgi:phage tail sheath protein FI
VSVNYLHGLETTELNDGSGPVVTGKSNVIGLVGTAPNADPAIFPLNTPVAVFANTLKASALKSDGTLLDAIDAIYSQQASVVVVTRVAEGTTQAETWSNTAGSPSGKTGLFSLLNARPLLGVVPKLLIAPGLTSDRPTNGVAAAHPVVTGNGYVASTTTVTFGAPAAGGRIAKGVAQVVGGSVTAIVVTDPGFGYTDGTPSVTINGEGTGATAEAVLGGVANPVGVALGSIVDRLRAVAFIDGPGVDYDSAIAGRGDYGSSRLAFLDPGVLKWDTASSSYVTRPGSAYAAGIQAMVDDKYGFWYSFSNRVIQNIGGSSRPIDWMPNDANAEANLLNENQITTIIHNNGYKFWGLRGTGTEELWAQLAVRRTADMIYEAVEAAEVDAMDKPFSIPLLKNVQGSVQDYIDLLVSRGALIGGRCWIDPSVNTPSTFATGQLTIDYDLEPPASIEHMIFRARRNINYYNNFVEEFAAQAGVISSST